MADDLEGGFIHAQLAGLVREDVYLLHSVLNRYFGVQSVAVSSPKLE